jgi:peptidoglycan/xylan/chitin deacetylase (PgdA/CDA1 family)
MLPPIAMLHHVSDAPAHESLGGWRISRRSFLRLLNYLEQNGYQTLTFEDLHGSARMKSRNRIILTFDDCPKHLFDFAIPELLSRKMKASFYMPTAYLGKYNAWDVEEGRAKVELMDENDLLELSRLGMEIGSHSHHHVKLKNVKTEAEIQYEVAFSKAVIEQMIKKTVLSFSYPFASVPKQYKKILSAAGYQYGLSIYQPFETKLALRRFGYYDIDSEERIKRKLSVWYNYFRTLSDPLTKH